MNWVRHGGSTTFEIKSSYCRVARQALPSYTAIARLGFKRRAAAVLKLNLIRSIEFGTAVARRLKQALLKSSCLFMIAVVLIHTEVSHVFCYLYSIYFADSIDRGVIRSRSKLTFGRPFDWNALLQKAQQRDNTSSDPLSICCAFN